MAEARAEAALRKLRNRIWLGNVLERLSVTLVVSAAGVFLLTAARHVVVLPYFAGKAAVLLAALWAAGGIWALAGRPGIKQAAAAGDRLGLQDRLSTYLEYGDRDGAVVEAFREELESVLAGFDPARMYRLVFPWKRMLASVIIFTAAGCVFWLPSPRAEEAAWREEVNRELRQEAENVALIKKGLEEKAGEEEAPAGSLEKNAAALLRELEKKLERGYDYREAALQVAGALQELPRRGRGLDPADVRGLAGIFEGVGEKTAEAAGLLRSGDAGGAARALGTPAFKENERRAMLENVRRLLAGRDLSGPQRQVLQEIKAALEKEGFHAGDLAKVLSSAPSVKKEAPELKETETKLQSLKERLLAKSGGGTGRPGGAGGGEFAPENAADPLGGDTAGREAATARGDFSGRFRREPWALGGGGVPGGGATGETGREGRVEKSDAPVFAPAAGSGSLEARGEWRENSGRVGERRSDRVLGLAGDGGGREALYRDFQREDAASPDGYALPSDKRRLVLEYFRVLRGDDADGGAD